MGTLVRDEHSCLASEIFSLPYLQRPAAVRFGDSAAHSFGESDKTARAACKGKHDGKTPKGGQVLACILSSALVLEWFGGFRLRHKPLTEMPGGRCLHAGEPSTASILGGDLSKPDETKFGKGGVAFGRGWC